jgi:D-beta-D-heptose 7-phosphate kinase/D-beta-D-heptose 1-phosphate adenosyltransferase
MAAPSSKVLSNTRALPDVPTTHSEDPEVQLMAKKSRSKTAAKSKAAIASKKKTTRKSPAARAPAKSARAQSVRGLSRKPVVVMVSGGFDPVHIGHVRMFNEAKKLGDKLVVVINNDNWLKTKKGYAFMPEAERKEIIENFRSVDVAMLTKHKLGTKDMSVCHMLDEVRPTIFANGGDRDVQNAHTTGSSLKPEYALCEKLGIKMVFNVGAGGKVQSSSDLVKAAKAAAMKK